MIETLVSITTHQHAVITAQTFGHLAPKPKTDYKGWILFTLTAFGDTCLIDFEFGDLDASPWFNIDCVEYVADYTDKLKQDFGVFRWEGTYKKYKNGNCKFKGKFKEIKTS